MNPPRPEKKIDILNLSLLWFLKLVGRLPVSSPSCKKLRSHLSIIETGKKLNKLKTINSSS